MRVIFTNKFQHFARVHATRTAKRRQQVGRTSMSVMFVFLYRYLQAIPFAAVRLPPGASCPGTMLPINTHSVRYLMNENCMKGAQSLPATTHFRNRWVQLAPRARRGRACDRCAAWFACGNSTHIYEKRRVPTGALRASGLIGRREACGGKMARRTATEGMGR